MTEQNQNPSGPWGHPGGAPQAMPQQPTPGYGPPPTQGTPPGYGAPPGYGHPAPYYGGPPMGRHTNGMAIASMVLGIVWLWWVGSVLALVFGYIARTQIRQRNEAGDGMAIAGIVLGWVGVGTFLLFFIIGIAASSSGPGY